MDIEYGEELPLTIDIYMKLTVYIRHYTFVCILFTLQNIFFINVMNKKKYKFIIQTRSHFLTNENTYHHNIRELVKKKD